MRLGAHIIMNTKGDNSHFELRFVEPFIAEIHINYICQMLFNNQQYTSPTVNQYFKMHVGCSGLFHLMQKTNDFI